MDNINTAVRKGDVYGFLIEHYSRASNFKNAKHLIDELVHAIPNVNLAYYVNTEVLRAVERALGIRLLQGGNDEGAAGAGAGEGNFVEEEVVD